MAKGASAEKVTKEIRRRIRCRLLVYNLPWVD